MDQEADEQFRLALGQYQDKFSLHISASQIEKLALHYQLVLKWNRLLHLTTLTNPLDFALRNVLESAFALSFLSPNIQKIVDIGSGSGLPGIPLAVFCPNLPITLIEANRRKATFLKEAITLIGATNLSVINKRFEELSPADIGSCIASRALEQLTEQITTILHFGEQGEQFLFWGSVELSFFIQSIARPTWNVSSTLLPLSDKRLLISVTRST